MAEWLTWQNPGNGTPMDAHARGEGSIALCGVTIPASATPARSRRVCPKCLGMIVDQKCASIPATRRGATTYAPAVTWRDRTHVAPAKGEE